jgi:glycosyltransferase involved in cell wall biosynthesis
MIKNKILRYFSFPDEKIITIDLGVDTNVYHPMKYKEEDYILFPNALRYPNRKGTYFILPVLNRLFKKHKNMKCILSGNLSPEGKEILKKLPNNFKHIGFTSKDEMAQLYNKAMYVIFPSLHEGYGLVPKETMACGGVVISTDVGAVSEYLKTGINGFILKLNEEIWFQTMDNLIKNSSLRESIRKNNRNEKINSWKECAQEHFEFFKKILEKQNKI